MLRQLVIINENPARFFLILILISGILPNSVQSEIRQLILENNAHMQCHTSVKSSCIGSINSSFLFKSADCLNKIGAQKQSLWLLLLWDYGKTHLYQVFTSSSSKVVSANATALHAIRAVLKRRFELWWLNACFLTFSRLRLISLLATARFDTRAVISASLSYHDWMPSFLFSVDLSWFLCWRLPAISPEQSTSAELNKVHCPPSFLFSVD